MTPTQADELEETGLVSTQASRPVKRSFSIRGHRTSLSLEAAFWDALVDIAIQHNQSVAHVVANVDEARGDSGLSGAVRIFILNHYRRAAQGLFVRGGAS